MPICGRTARASSTTSWPSTKARPAVGSRTVERIFTSVVLPAPFGPSSPCTSLPAGASPGIATQIVAQSLLMPGVSYQREVQFTPHGPVVLDVVTAPRPDGSLYTLAPGLSNGAIVATEKLTDMEKTLSATST